jgi:hypothetical protein
VRLGDIANEGAAPLGKPLDGVRILALEQMQSLPFATQLLGRLGAEVVKVEHPKGGDSGRGSLPAMTDPEGRRVGATFLRNNLSKRSICVDLKHPEGRDLILRPGPALRRGVRELQGRHARSPGPRVRGRRTRAPRRRSTCRCRASAPAAPPTIAGRLTPPSPRPCRASTSSSARAMIRRWSLRGRPRRHRLRPVRRDRRDRGASPPRGHRPGPTSTSPCSMPSSPSATSSRTSGRWGCATATSAR